MKEFFQGLGLAIVFMFCWMFVGSALGMGECHSNCECRELTRIRLLLEHQFGVICDERHCEGSSSSGQGGSLP